MRKLKIIGYLCMSLVMVIGVLTIVASGGGGDSDDSDDTTINPYNIEPSTITTFTDLGLDICLEDGKPIIRMYTNSGCEYCKWDSKAFDPVVKMYVNKGLIIAHHWELNTGDDLLTDEKEMEVPESEREIYNTFNPNSTVPTFVFGCTYKRVGAYTQRTLEAEAAEFMAVIVDLLDSSAQ